MDVIEVLQELTDDDVESGEDGNEGEEDDASSASRLAVAQLIDDLVRKLLLCIWLTESLLIPSSNSWSPI